MYLFDLSLEDRVFVGISAMLFLFGGFLISFVISQRKKLQYHKEVQSLHEEQNTVLAQQNTLLEHHVRERTIELVQQKEALQTSLTELRSAQMNLVQREKMASLGELVAGIAHELQNPLNFVNNFSEVSVEIIDELKEEIKADHKNDALAITDDLTENIQKIAHHGGRAAAIIKGMLDHSRGSLGECRLTNLNTLTDDYLRLALNVFKVKESAYNVLILTDFDPELSPVSVVPEELGRVLVNLFNNAFYAVGQKSKSVLTGYQPEVKVSTHRLTKGVEIKVNDNGTGIPGSTLPKIFQPFFTTKPTGQGTGLGLSLSYDIIIKGHSGELRVESIPGESTQFTVWLPA